jgi:hypothetical protein
VILQTFCSAHLEADWGTLLPQYTTSAECAEPNGAWIATVGEFCSNGIYNNEIDCTEPNGTWTVGTCSGGNYSEQLPCLASGVCSDAQYNNNETNCLGAGTCTDGSYYDQALCEGAGHTWNSANNTWTSDGYTWTPGSCSDVGFVTEETCIAPRAVWTPEDTEHCSEPAFLTQVYCEAQRGAWNMNAVTPIEGTEVELTGEGIDLDWKIEIGDIEQITSAILLPTRVKMTLTEGTPLGDQDFKITNTAGDYSAYSDPFAVKQYMRIVTVYQPDPIVSSTGDTVSGSGFGDGSQSLIYGPREAQFKIFGYNFDPACTVTAQKSSTLEHPQNYLLGGDNSIIYDSPPASAGNYGITTTYVSSTELHVMLTVAANDIPAGHDYSIGGDKFGVMYYNITVTNPDGETYTEVASAVPGSPSKHWLTNFDNGLPYAGDNGTGQGVWNAHSYESGHGVRIWDYELPLDDVALSLTAANSYNNYAIPTWWDITGSGFKPGSVVTIEDHATHTITLTGGMNMLYFSHDHIRIQNVYGGHYGDGSAPNGSYDVIVTNPDGTFILAHSLITDMM